MSLGPGCAAPNGAIGAQAATDEHRARVAHHEAGHAVGALALGLDFDEVTMVHTGEAQGCCVAGVPSLQRHRA